MVICVERPLFPLVISGMKFNLFHSLAIYQDVLDSPKTLEDLYKQLFEQFDYSLPLFNLIYRSALILFFYFVPT
jgi:hypothetical protein